MTRDEVDAILLMVGTFRDLWIFPQFVPEFLGYKWVLGLLATPVVFWAGGIFFVKAWRSIVHRSPNMFTLIAVGVGSAYVFSALAVIAPLIDLFELPM